MYPVHHTTGLLKHFKDIIEEQGGSERCFLICKYTLFQLPVLICKYTSSVARNIFQGIIFLLKRQPAFKMTDFGWRDYA